MGAIALGLIIYKSIVEPIIEWWQGWCYIATMVYGSYDAPEVIVLRRFRDEKLAPHVLGRVFIFFYYKLSPVFVRLFRNNKRVNRAIKYILDAWVKKLKAKEVERMILLRRSAAG